VEVRPYRATLPRSAEAFAGLWVRRCRACSGCFADPPPEEEVLHRYYAADYRAEGSWHRLEREPGGWDGSVARARAQYEFVLRQAALVRRPATIQSWLDIGAGYGFLLDEVRKGKIINTAAIELDEHSRARLARSGHGLYDALKQVQGTWDVVSFSHLLEHLPAPRRFLSEIKPLLSNTGYVFCEVPNETYLDEATNDAPHLQFFTTDCIAHLFASDGFEVLDVETCGRKWKRGRAEALGHLTRRLGMRLVTAPPRWLDRAVHPHFHYSQSGRQWIRLLARYSTRS